MKAANEGPAGDWTDVPDETEPTEVADQRQRERPRRAELHGADDPEGWKRGLFASVRTVRGQKRGTALPLVEAARTEVIDAALRKWERRS